MTNKEMLHEAIYKAAADGVSKLIKNGLAFTVMAGVIAGLFGVLLYMHDTHKAEVAQMREEMMALRREHAEQLNEMRREAMSMREEIAVCNEARRQDSARIARLEALLTKRNR